MSRSISPISILLLALISIILVIIFQLYTSFNEEEKSSSYSAHFDELRILEKDFNIFLLNSLGYKDYDQATRKQARFELLISELKDSDISRVYEYDFTPSLKNIYQIFIKSSKIIEYQKSLHAMTINKITYLLDLRKTISYSKKISIDEKNKVDEVSFILIQFFNGLNNVKNLEEKLRFSGSRLKNKYLNRFYKSSSGLLKDVMELNKLHKEYNQLRLKATLEVEEFHLDKLNELRLKDLEKMSLIFSILVLILLIILIILHRISLKFEESLKITSSVFENIDEGILITDENQKIIDINESMTKIFGYTKEESIGKKLGMLQLGSDSDIFYKKMWSKVIVNGSWQGKVDDRAKDGTIIPSWMSVNVVKNSNGETLNYIVSPEKPKISLF